MFVLNHAALTGVSLAAATALLPTLALAHPGHGLANAAHWHASDSAGLVLLVVAMATGLWWAVRK